MLKGWGLHVVFCGPQVGIVSTKSCHSAACSAWKTTNKQIKNTTFLHPRFTFEFRVCKYFCHVQDGKCLLTGATVLFQSGLSCSFISITEHAQTCTMLQDVAYFVQQAGKITVRANQKYPTGPREMCRYSPCPWKSVIKHQPLIHSLCKTKEK